MTAASTCQRAIGSRSRCSFVRGLAAREHAAGETGWKIGFDVTGGFLYQDYYNNFPPQVDMPAFCGMKGSIPR